MRDITRQFERIEPARQDRAREILGKAQRILTQKTKDKHKLFAFQAPEVECIAKGKAGTPYGFGVKVTDRHDTESVLNNPRFSGPRFLRSLMSDRTTHRARESRGHKEAAAS